MKFDVVLEDKNEERYKKIGEKLRKNQKTTPEEEEFFIDYLVNVKSKKRIDASYKRCNAEQDYLSKNKEAIELRKKIGKVWNEMENNQPSTYGFYDNDRKWLKLKAEYDKLMKRLDKITKDFWDSYEE